MQRLILILCTSLAAILISATTTSAVKQIFAASETSQECKDAAHKISSKAEAHQSKEVCGIGLSRDSPTLILFGKKINDQVSMEFAYQPASASPTSKILMLGEFTLLQNEANQVNQYLLGQHWTVTAIHNHQF